jgi:SSS family solute:Na+ symporter
MDKKKGILLFSVLAVGCLVLAGDWPSTMHIYRGSTPVLDGRIGEDEYKDAVVFHGADGWNDQFVNTPVSGTDDLSFTGWIKHDGTNLYFAFDITDDVLYGYETGRWVPDENPDRVHDFTKSSFPWFGDGLELLINAGYVWPEEDDTYNYGDARSWQVVCNHSKSLLGGIGRGGLIQGEQRSDPNAWINHEKWIRSGAMQAVTKVKSDKTGYIVEWMITPECLQVDDKGTKWSPKLGTVKMGLNIGVQDLDRRDTAPDNWGRIHHEVWWAGEPDKRTWPKQWGTLFVHPDPKSCKGDSAKPEQSAE